ncbi:MAG: hypothetical protein ABR949_10320 [Candidatus Aquilonibacter sp.]|jgi:hypothetical protein
MRDKVIAAAAVVIVVQFAKSAKTGGYSPFTEAEYKDALEIVRAALGGIH